MGASEPDGIDSLESVASGALLLQAMKDAIRTQLQTEAGAWMKEMIRLAESECDLSKCEDAWDSLLDA